MKILSCYVAAFGGLKDKSYDFEQGLHCMLSDNGTGKTTLTVFLKAMLFGMTPSTKRSITENEYRHYTPWQGGRFGGSLTFETEGKRYRIERFFRPDSFSLIDLSTGAPSHDFSEKVGEELFDVDAEAFMHSIYMPAESRGVKSDDRISAKLNALTGEVFDLSSYGNAEEILLKARKEIEGLNGRGGRLPAIKGEIAALKERLHRSRSAEAAAAELSPLLSKEEAALAKLEGAVKLCTKAGAEQAALRRKLEEDTAECRRLAPLFEKGIPEEADLTALGEAEREFTLAQSRLSAARLAEENAKAASEAVKKRPLPERPFFEHIPHDTETADRQEPPPRFPLLTPARLSLAASLLAIALLLGLTVFLPLLALSVLAVLPLLPLPRKDQAAEEARRREEEEKRAEARRREEARFAEERARLQAALEAAEAALIRAEQERTAAEEASSTVGAKRQTLFEHYQIKEELRPFSLPLYREQAARYRELLQKEAATRELLEEKESLTEALLKATLPLLTADTPEALPTPEAAEQLLAKKRRELTEQAARLRGYEVAAAGLAEEKAEFSRLTEEQRALAEKKTLLDLTRLFLEQAKTNLEKQYLSGISERFTHYLGALFGENAPEYDLSTALSVRFIVGGEGKENDYFSSGIRALTEICLRLALSDCLYPTSPPPLFLDDPFALLDGTHLERAKEVLRTLAEERQILYFCAHPSRAFY